MSTSFISALGALRAHQDWIDVIGNNLANQNTAGFKSSRALFSDLLSITHRPATPPTGSIGGTNPLQVGLGTQLATVDRRHQQGSLDTTGRPFDLALLGNGFFALSDGNQSLYSRVGAFGLDAQGSLVDLRSGFNVQDASGASIQVDTSAVIPPQATSLLRFSGNLPAEIGGPLAEELSSSSAYAEGTAAQTIGANAGSFTIPVGETWTMELVLNGGAPQLVSIAGTGAALTAQEVVDEINAQTEDVVASTNDGAIELVSERSGLRSTIKIDAGETAKDLKGLLGLADFVQGTESTALLATNLNDLSGNLADYATGDGIEISGTDVDGTPVVASFVYGADGTTLGELVSFVDAQFGQSTAVFDETSGVITITADTKGEAQLSLSISDRAGQVGSSDWAAGFFAVTTNGTGPDKVTTSAEVFDAAGQAHVVTFEYIRQDDGTWNVDVGIPAEEGEVLSGTIGGLAFNENGSLQTPSNAQVQIQFTDQSVQDIDLELGVSGQFEGLTQFGDPSSVIAEFQDGFAAGTLANVDVRSDGGIEAFYTNGQTQVVATLGIATFANQAALREEGDSYFVATANSGSGVLGAAQSGSKGEIVSGSLEASNVDTAEEFVRLIQAQRGFQANARVVTVQDELLAEVVNVI